MKTIKVNDWSNVPNNFTGIVEYSNGTKIWHQNGKYHREDGPAIEFSNGPKYWYQNGYLHRENGPAVVYPRGRKEWYIKGEEISEIAFKVFRLCLEKK